MAFPVRLWFKKSDSARFISHLDLNRTMLRAIRRAQLPVWYTEGFNKHPYVTFPCPLSIFFCGEREIMDFKLETGVPFAEIVQRLNAQMPQGIEILRVAVPKNKPTLIKYASYTVDLKVEGLDTEQTVELLDKAKQSDELLIEKKTKKGVKTLNVIEYLKNAEISGGGQYAQLKLNLPCGTQENVNPSLIVEAFLQKYSLTEEYSLYVRHEHYLEDMTVFE